MNWGAIALAFLVSLSLTPVVKWLAPRLGALDQPDARKIHTGVIPRLGGLAIFAGFIAGYLVGGEGEASFRGMLWGAALILLVGLADDIWALNPRWKLAGQVAAALIVMVMGVRVEFLTNPFNGLLFLGPLAIPVTLLWLVGVTNALNLVDGLDGLAGGTALIAAVTMSIIAWLQKEVAVSFLALILAASILGFLPYNFHPASIFMGDSGSMFLGFTLASLAVLGLTKTATVISLFVPVVILGLPILDTFLAIIRRLLNHRPIFQPDKGHLHHCLIAQGFSQRQAVFVIYLVNLILGASAILLTRLTTDQGMVILIFLTFLALWGGNKLGVTGYRFKPSKTRRNAFPS
ncbi:UDP-GlcNAc:undecaprenyl-phosphate GlcNAc-1-phosphate transferase [Thermanaeromonas toyohensis ToBE]|uniref:UDP-GlcNAc:undecaprenyl-phosphate GlcNAc-1-phosphate transferase n=1 Tax=Thermanaeromonas toyohensis ToBE TaxID=698762 RepID=A0A1W1VDJ8_9FIRM|nr:MraY family glycosyltransferase [Thermanaeromonas toyohensis]SMB91396.1 UDP-GlcNAc:undecaprenyl-phosphate GlcNAc-1-phosphate transferase [Thermanaeromonas toyohensis ToBE]